MTEGNSDDELHDELKRLSNSTPPQTTLPLSQSTQSTQSAQSAQSAQSSLSVQPPVQKTRTADHQASSPLATITPSPPTCQRTRTWMSPRSKPAVRQTEKEMKEGEGKWRETGIVIIFKMPPRKMPLGDTPPQP